MDAGGHEQAFNARSHDRRLKERRERAMMEVGRPALAPIRF